MSFLGNTPQRLESEFFLAVEGAFSEFLNVDIIDKVIASMAVANDILIVNKMNNVMKLHVLVFPTVCHCTSSQLGRVNIDYLLFTFHLVCPATSCMTHSE